MRTKYSQPRDWQWRHQLIDEFGGKLPATAWAILQAANRDRIISVRLEKQVRKLTDAELATQTGKELVALLGQYTQRVLQAIARLEEMRPKKSASTALADYLRQRAGGASGESKA